MNVISLKETYANRQILLLGGLGFLGKVLLVMLLKKLPEIKRIYLIVRSTPLQNAQDRFLEALQHSPVFEILRSELGQNFLSFVNERVTAISGNVSLPHFGIESKETLAQLQNDVDLVINSAGLVTFNPDLPSAFRSNVQGAIYAAEFVKQSRKSSLLHISTCYVAGNVSGRIPEEMRAAVTPTGTAINAPEEIELLKQWIQNIPNSNKLKKMAIDRVKALGWPNIYTYTKALAESWLETEKTSIRCTIVRPSILESTLSFPFPGWNEGFTTSAPLVKFSESGYRFIVGKNESILDILPIDLCCAQIVKIGAFLLLGKSSPVYQCGTSSKNPLYMQKTSYLTTKRYQKKYAFFAKVPFLNKIHLIGVNHPLSCFSVYSFLSKLPKKWISKSKFLRQMRKTMHAFCKLTEILLPFIYHNNYIFASDLVDQIEVSDSGWETDPSQIDWDDYWLNIHLPGLEKWCFKKHTIS